MKSVAFVGHWLALSIVLTGIVSSGVSAQDRTKDTRTITVSVTQPVKVQAKRVRLVLPLQAEGRDAAEAAKNLAAHKAKVKEALQEMKADISSIEYRDSTLGLSPSSSPAMAGAMGGMAWAQVQVAGDFAVPNVVVGGANEPEPAAELPKIFHATSQLVVDWTLPTQDASALLVLPETLKLQIEKRDLPGTKNKVELTDEETEAIQGAARRGQANGIVNFATPYAQRPSASNPQILFVGILSKDNIASAMKSAFATAKEEATIIAEATGHKLGGVIRVDRNADMSEQLSEPPVPYYAYDPSGTASVASSSPKKPREVTGRSSEGLETKILASFTFAME